ncbi:MAG TPA: hypothetical protein ENK43_07695, partial [Planctomycetes bacterium]|nr:hypothetical protein [Planctomycetota bacterium]
MWSFEGRMAMRCLVVFLLGLAASLGDLSPCVAQGVPPLSLWQVNSIPNGGPVMGKKLWRLGDLDQDGVDDLAVFLSSQWAPDEIQILSGATGAVIHSYQALSLNPTLQLSFESIVPNCFDQDGDGVEDFMVGFKESDIATGVVTLEWRIMSGATGVVVRVPPTLIAPFTGVADYDGDGLPDILAGDTSQVVSSVGIYSSVTGQLLIQTTGTVPFGAFGWDVKVVGDVNGDGWDDYVTTEGNSAYPGSPTFVYMISGVDGSILYSLVGTPTFLYGRYVAKAGDMNGDGIPDFAVQAGYPISVEVHSGVDGSLIHSIGRPGPLFVNGVLCTTFGWTLVGGEDLDGDAVPDLVIGDPLAPNAAGDASAGRIYLLSGAAGTLTEMDQGGFSSTFVGCGPGGGLGESLAMLGDVNGDGLADVAVGAPNQLVNPNQYGFVRAYAGQPWTSDGARAGNVNANGVGGVVDVLRVDAGMTGQPSAGQG